MKRYYFLDHLRTLMIFFVIAYHAIYIFTSGLANSWMVVSANKTENLSLVSLYLDTFVMFLLFYISGFFVRQSAQKKSILNFVKDKANRLLLPWLFGVLTMIPLYKIIFLYSRNMPQEAWYTYFHFYSRAGSDLSLFSNNPVQNWLWFLPVLFAFQIVYIFLKKSNLLKNNLNIQLAIILTVVIGVIYSMTISLLGFKGWYHSWIFHFQNERLLVYFLFFLLGSKTAQLELFSKPLSKKIYIVSNVVMTLGLTIYTIVALNLFFNLIDPSRNFYFISSIADRIIYYLSMLLSTLIFIHILIYPFHKSLNKPLKLWNNWNRNSYYVYIIHLVVMGFIALATLQLPIPNWINYLLITILTFFVSNGLVSLYYKLTSK